MPDDETWDPLQAESNPKDQLNVFSGSNGHDESHSWRTIGVKTVVTSKMNSWNWGRYQHGKLVIEEGCCSE
eukprot:scaffold268934_cov13-Tisochrysis_lutea.AAC.1